MCVINCTLVPGFFFINAFPGVHPGSVIFRYCINLPSHYSPGIFFCLHSHNAGQDLFLLRSPRKLDGMRACHSWTEAQSGDISFTVLCSVPRHRFHILHFFLFDFKPYLNRHKNTGIILSNFSYSHFFYCTFTRYCHFTHYASAFRFPFIAVDL